MNKILYVLSIVLLVTFCSCRSKKEVTSNKLDEELIKKIEAFIHIQDSIVSSRKEIFNFNQITKIIEREFDTSVAPDSAGNYPVVKEKITVIDKTGEKKVEEETESKTKTDINIEEDQKQNKKEETVIQKEVKENSSFKYLFMCLAIVLLVIVLVFFKRLGFLGK